MRMDEGDSVQTRNVGSKYFLPVGIGWQVGICCVRFATTEGRSKGDRNGIRNSDRKLSGVWCAFWV
jgi:hypothetical protein